MTINKITFTCLVFSVLLITSCSLEKRRYNSGFHVEWLASMGHQKQEKSQSSTYSNRLNQPKFDSRKKKLIISTPIDSSSVEISSNSTLDIFQPTNEVNEGTNEDSVKCDLMILRNGDELAVKVIEIGEELVKYKLCDNLEGPVFVKRASDIFMVKYPNGTKTVFETAVKEQPTRESTNSKDSNRNTHNAQKVTPIASIIGFISGITSLLVLPIVFGLIAIILGAIGYSQNISQPDKYKGQSLAIWAIALGVVGIVVPLIILFLL
jgi:hypothetical protein